MGAYLGLRDSWFWGRRRNPRRNRDASGPGRRHVLPGRIRAGGPHGHACPNLWGYLIPQEESEPFERLFAAREDEQVAKLYGTRFAYARWYNGADGEPKVGFLPAPVSREEPLAGGVGKKATWARFWTWGPALEDNIDMSCDLVTGWCEIEYVSRKRDLPAARFRVAAAKLAPYATIGEGVHYGERGESPWMIYDGFYWSYILGTDDAVLLRGTRSGSSEKSYEPILSLFRSIRRSARGVDAPALGIRHLSNGGEEPSLAREFLYCRWVPKKQRKGHRALRGVLAHTFAVRLLPLSRIANRNRPCPNGWVPFIRVHLGQRAGRPAQGRSQNTQHQTRQKRRTTDAGPRTTAPRKTSIPTTTEQSRS